MMQIKSLIIYGKNGKRRILNFKIGKENIISGMSKTGKSTIGQIIEYCLGTEECGVSVGIVRQYTDWFGLLLVLDKEECFVARKNPDLDKKYCSTMFYEIAKEIAIPAKANWTSNIDNKSFSKILTSRIGIEENIHYAPINSTRENLSANIKHALLYCFQYQYEIASPIRLFHKEQEDFIQQSIKDSMPYFLGVVDKKQIDLKQEVQELKRKLLLLERKEKERISINGGKNRVLQMLAEATEVGLIDASNFSEDDDISTLIKFLKNIESMKFDSLQKFYKSDDSLTENQLKLQDLENQESILNQKISDVKHALKITDEYQGEKAEQKKRLDSLELFNKLNFSENTCPFCNQKIDNIYPCFDSLEKSLKELEKNLDNLTANELPLRTYLKQLMDEKKELSEQIKNIQTKIISIQDSLDDIDKYKNLSVRQGKVIGRISLWLESYKEEPLDEKVKNQLEQLISEKEKILSEENINEIMESRINLISADMSKWASELNLEYSNCPYRFSFHNMTVFVDSVNEGAIPLRVLGSGSNWVGIHLLAYFAFQKYFIEKNCPVPSFLLLDQPSQVYFPNSNNKTDWEAVKKIYKFIGDRVKELNEKLQVIILDHADFPEDFDLNNATIERWDDIKNALIPYDWIDDK